MELGGNMLSERGLSQHDIGKMDSVWATSILKPSSGPLKVSVIQLCILFLSAEFLGYHCFACLV